MLVSKPIMELIQRYRNGIRGHAKFVLSSLLRRYLDTEALFSTQVHICNIVLLPTERWCRNSTTPGLHMGIGIPAGLRNHALALVVTGMK